MTYIIEIDSGEKLLEEKMVKVKIIDFLEHFNVYLILIIRMKLSHSILKFR